MRPPLKFLLANKGGAGAGGIAARQQQAGEGDVPERIGVGDLPGLIVLHALADAGFGFVQPVPLAQHIAQHDAWVTGHKEAPFAALLRRWP